MIRVACPTCQTRYRFDEGQLGGKSRATAKCQKCGGVIEIGAAEADLVTTRPTGSGGTPPGNEVGTSTAAAPARTQDTTARVQRIRSDESPGGETITGHRVAEVLQLPPDKKYSLAILQGKASGQIFQIQKVKTILGRSDCDIVLDDPECSRQHASLEILGARVVVTDLNSTNGTFVQGERIDNCELENHHEFRIGEHVMMLIVTDRE
jgi:predicted Zn finger-like uncharacterized protein